MKPTTKRFTTVLVALMVVASMGLAMAAAPSVDTETTDTSSQTDLQDTNTITYNESTTSYLQFSADSENGSLVIFQGDRQLVEYENGTADVTHVDTVSGTHYLNVSLADDGADFPGIRADPGETVDLTLSMVNDTSLDYSAADKTNITVSFANDANTTFENLGATETETSEPSIFARTFSSVPVFGSDNLTTPAQAERTVNVTGADQDQIVINVADSDAQTALDESTTDVTGVAYKSYAKVGGQFVPVVSSAADAPDWVGADQAYVTVADDGSQATVWNAGTLLDEGQESATVSVTGAEQLNVFEIRSMMNSYGADSLNILTTSLANGEYFGAASDQFEG